MQEMTRISFALGTSAMINTKTQDGDKHWDMDKWTLYKNVYLDKICQILIPINMYVDTFHYDYGRIKMPEL